MGVQLEVKNLMVFYENALALNDFNMEVRDKEFVGVLGSNSAGKSTLMNTIAGLMEDKRVKEKRKGGVRITIQGEIQFEGENIIKLRPRERVKRGIVLSRERHPVFRDSDAEENLKIAAYLQKNSEIKKTIDTVYEIFPLLAKLKKRKAGFFSGGEQQMLIVGMTLMARPRLLLLDEPLLGLAPVIQSSLVSTIRDINRRDITVLITEQFARPILPHIHRGYILEHGMLALAGSGSELSNNSEVRSAYFGV
jgi:branched-chain amino acid transport system ATP-binding protein